MRSTLLALPSPVPRRKQVLRKSELWETLRLARQNDEGVDEVLLGAGGGVLGAPGQKSMVVEQVVPWLSLINPPGASPRLTLVRRCSSREPRTDSGRHCACAGTSPFLLSLSTFPPLSTAAQPLVTGAAIGEKDVSALTDEAGDEDAPSVDLSEPRRGGRVLQELEEDDDEEDVKPVVPAPAGGRGGKKGEVELLYDPDDDIEED